MRRRARKDANHKALVAEFERLGCSVLDLSRLGDGAPDILIAFGGLTMLVEIKSKNGKLTDDQVDFWNRWKSNPRIVRNEEQAFEAVSTLARWHKAITRQDVYNQEHDPA